MGSSLFSGAAEAFVGVMAGTLIPGVGTLIGASVGTALELAEHMRRIEAGRAYLQYIKDGVDPQAAQLGAGLAGLVNAAIEILQVGQVVKTIPDGKALLQKGLR